uniref:Putative secreted protein n=1 Tax=Ixodes ricinus TaxID=34613 RepID=A0A6B0U2S9_IXORI
MSWLRQCVPFFLCCYLQYSKECLAAVLFTAAIKGAQQRPSLQLNCGKKRQATMLQCVGPKVLPWSAFHDRPNTIL